MHLWAEFKFELHAHAPAHQSCFKNHMCFLGWISRSHARNGNEIQTSGHRGLAGKIEKLGFLIPINPKHAWKSWNLAWCHDMALTCYGNFFVWFAKVHTLKINKVIFGTSVVTLQIRNTSIIETVGVLLTNYVPPRVPFFIGLEVPCRVAICVREAWNQTPAHAHREESPLPAIRRAPPSQCLH